MKIPRGRGTALVLGGAECVWEDYDALREMMGEEWPGAVLVVNDMGYKRTENGRLWTHPIHHWCTLHAEKMAGWRRMRRAEGLSEDYQSWSSVRRTIIQNNFQGWTGGSSGQYAVGVALLALRHPRAVGCGIPMDNQRNIFSGMEWKACSRYLKGWTRKEAAQILMGRFKSMSGWTRATYGAPTTDWIGLVPSLP